MSKNNSQLFLTQLSSLRNTLMSAADQIDVLLELADRPVEEVLPSQCPHPMGARRPIPAMGHPHRFYCNACEQEIEGNNGQKNDTVKDRSPKAGTQTRK